MTFTLKEWCPISSTYFDVVTNNFIQHYSVCIILCYSFTIEHYTCSVIQTPTSHVHSARVDCLAKRELTANEMTEHFKDRPDYLYYRHTTYGKVSKQRALETTLNKDSNLKPIIKIVERFHHNPSIPANSDVAERVFLLDENRIRVAYHLEKDRITPSSREFVTPSVSGDQGYTLHFDPEMTTAFQVNNPMSCQS